MGKRSKLGKRGKLGSTQLWYSLRSTEICRVMFRQLTYKSSKRVLGKRGKRVLVRKIYFAAFRLF